jgi:hypothetical protein
MKEFPMAVDVRKTLQDAAYITVGFGVLAFQKAQVNRREARARVEKNVERVKSQVEGLAGQVKSRVEPLTEQLQGRLPAQVGKALETGRARLTNSVSSAA